MPVCTRLPDCPTACLLKQLPLLLHLLCTLRTLPSAAHKARSPPICSASPWLLCRFSNDSMYRTWEGGRLSLQWMRCVGMPPNTGPAYAPCQVNNNRDTAAAA